MDFFLTPMPGPRIELTSVQLHLLIHDVLPTELPRPQNWFSIWNLVICNHIA